jgi:hypothetical protein
VSPSSCPVAADSRRTAASTPVAPWGAKQVVVLLDISVTFIGLKTKKPPPAGPKGASGVFAAWTGAQTLGATLLSRAGQAKAGIQQSGRDAHGGGVCSGQGSKSTRAAAQFFRIAMHLLSV